MVKKDEVIRLANMAKLKFEEDELEKVTEKLQEMIDLAENIMEVDTDGVEPTLNINDSGHLKDYEDSESLTREEALQNTVEEQYGYFKILKVVD